MLSSNSKIDFFQLLIFVQLTASSSTNKTANEHQIQNHQFLVKNLISNSTTFRNVSFDAAFLPSFHLSQDQINHGWIEINGSVESFVTADGEHFLTETKDLTIPEPVVKVVQFNYLELENMTIDDIKDIPDCLSDIFLNLDLTTQAVKGEINLKKIFEHKLNSSDGGGGILLTTIEVQRCNITYQEFFETSKYGAFRLLDWTIDSIYPGSLVILNALNDGALLLNETSRIKLEKYGSKWSQMYSFKDIWTSIFIKGGPTLYEAIVPTMKNDNDFAPSLYVHLPIFDICTNWPETPQWKTRRIFCIKNNGFGRICDCRNPLQFLDHNKKINEELDIPIAIVTSSGRSKILVRLLEDLQDAKGVKKELFLISLDDRDDLILAIAFILDIKILLKRRGNERNNSKIKENTKFCLFQQLKRFPKAKNFIMLDDDVMLSSDFYKYMQSVSPIFEMDRSIWCVSGFNFLSYPHTAIDPSRLYRGPLLPVWGWMMPRTVLEEILPKWPPPEMNVDWDFYLVNEHMHKGRTCVVPEVLRSMHGHNAGIHLKYSLMTEKNFYQRVLNHHRNVTLQPLSSLVKETYDNETLRLIATAIPLTIKSKNFTFPFSENKYYIVYLNKSSSYHQISSIVLHQIFNIYDQVQIYVMDVEQFTYFNVTIFIVGHPSHFSKHIPKDYLFYIPSTNEIESYLEYREKITKKENAKKFSHRIEGNSVLDLEEIV